MQGTSRSERVFHPGEAVPESGVYTVAHSHHRQNHTATIFKGEYFPECGRCGRNVRFSLERVAAQIGDDIDFRQSCSEGAPSDGKP
ncbi:MAG TPA: hypothetical protein VKZ53_20335 [Candidatus Angelobacter sp.]|nr:hypothetical protein [Candidatus Angelobacter sp.]